MKCKSPLDRLVFVPPLRVILVTDSKFWKLRQMDIPTMVILLKYIVINGIIRNYRKAINSSNSARHIATNAIFPHEPLLCWRKIATIGLAPSNIWTSPWQRHVQMVKINAKNVYVKKQMHPSSHRFKSLIPARTLGICILHNWSGWNRNR